MRRRIVAVLLASLPTACIVQTDTITGDAGPPGRDGVDGGPGAPGVACWDLDGDGEDTAEEDVNHDGAWDALDCTGPQGDAGEQGNPGQDGLDGDQGPPGPPGVSPFSYSANMKDIYYNDGNIGVGTTTPTAKLHVKDGFIHARLESEVANGDIPLMFTNSADMQNWQLRYFGAFKGMSIYHDNSAQYLTTWLPNGNVGIGTSTPGADLPLLTPALDIVGPRGTLILRTTDPSGIATLRLTGPGNSLVDDWHVNMRAGGSSTLGISPKAGSIGDALTLTNNGKVGIGTMTPTSELTVNGYIQLSTLGGTAPPAIDCSNATQHGRMKVDEVNKLLYICVSGGWIAK